MPKLPTTGGGGFVALYREVALCQQCAKLCHGQVATHDHRGTPPPSHGLTTQKEEEEEDFVGCWWSRGGGVTVCMARHTSLPAKRCAIGMDMCVCVLCPSCIAPGGTCFVSQIPPASWDAAVPFE